MSSRSLIIFRTHFVDERIIGFIESISGDADYKVVLAVDEISQELDTQGLPKLSMSRKTFEDLQLYTELGDMLWRCGDYCLYLARHTYPDFVNYWLIEYDVAINRPDPINFFREFDDAQDHDFLSTHFREREPGWKWGDEMQADYAVVWRSYFPLVRLSGRAIDFLLERRRIATVKIMAIAPNFRPIWPNDESFVACELHYNGFKCADYATLGNCYDASTFFNDVLYHPSQLPAHDGKIYHMVRWGTHYLKVVNPGLNGWKRPTLRDLVDLEATGLSFEQIHPVLRNQLVFALGTSGDTPEKTLRPDGPVMTLLSDFPSAPVLATVVAALARLRLRLSIEALGRIAAERGWPRIEAFSNLALARPAWQSSISAWSKPHDYRLDAEGGNDGDLDVDFGFHTDAEADGYWTVDLQQPVLLTEVRIHNRRIYGERLDGFQLLVSQDGHDWQTAYCSPAAVQLDLNAEEPIRIPMFTPARLLRVKSAQRAFLHFRELEAYGRTIGEISGWEGRPSPPRMVL